MLFSHHSLTSWIIFHAVVLVALLVDFFALKRRGRSGTLKEALGWSIFWVLVGVLFSLYIHHIDGPTAALDYLTGYVVEKSLSVDNLFVFLVIFRAFRIPHRDQHNLLLWGIFGAIILRGAMVLAGAELLEHFHWVLYVFGVFLFLTGLKLLWASEEKFDPKDSLIYRVAQRFFRVDQEAPTDRFFIRREHRRFVTRAFLALLVIESSDVLFAVDSVPAVFGVTRDPYIVYTSNIFAILGLRALYFVLQDMLERFRYLKVGVALVLAFIGAKMCLEPFYKLSSAQSLIAVAAIFALSIAASLRNKP